MAKGIVVQDKSEWWRVITPSEFPWEQEAFDYVRNKLAAAPLTAEGKVQVWQGFSFVAENGSIYEVDLLVATPFGLFLVEVKSNPGRLTGDTVTWIWQHEGRSKTVDNPLTLANAKAKKLASLLRFQKAARDGGIPYVEALVFCSAVGLQLDLSEVGRTRVCVRDREATAEKPAREGILAALLRGVVSGVGEFRLPSIDRPAMARLARALESAGIRQSEGHRVIGDHRLKSLLMEGPGWQDWEGVHVSLAENRRRIRRYAVMAAASKEERSTLVRAARREFQVLDTLSHPGILSAKGFTENEYGPAIVFEHHPKAVRLDHYLAERHAKLSVDVRLHILRQVAEAVKHAHGKRVFHRSLSPQSVLVIDPDDAMPTVKIFNWQTAARELAANSGTTSAVAVGQAMTATIHVEQLVEGGSTAYLAPEASFDLGEGGGEQVDVFSLGATAYFLFTGQPPASSLLELHERVRSGRGLQVSSVMDAAPTTLQELVQNATHPDRLHRTSDIGDFLKALERVEEELMTPEEELTVNPLQAKKNDRLAGGFLVVSRLGAGSTSVVYEVDDGTDRKSVLKVARGPEYNDRLKEEAEVLQKLRHQSIVEVYRTVDVDGLTAILMQFAGEKTLGKRIEEEGRLHPDLLERFGEDLLQTVEWLEQQGIPHRDIKPDNIGVVLAGRSNQLHLVLFDFSLSRTSPDNIRAGTAKYMDPFLPLRRPTRWDSAAERFSAAITLYQMATAELPTWGDGKNEPSMIDSEVALDAERFDGELRDTLFSFFRKAFRRDPKERFDNAREMLDAWRAAFRSTELRPEVANPKKIDEAAIAAAELSTSVAALGLGTRALTALDRLGINTVADLLRVPSRRIWKMRGVGNVTRRNLGEVVGKLRSRFPEVKAKAPVPEKGTSTDVDVSNAAAWSIDRIAAALVPTSGSKAVPEQVDAVKVFLGLVPLKADASAFWPTQAEVAESRSLNKVKFNQWVDARRQRWVKDPSLTQIRIELAEILDSRAGVMAAPDLARALLALRGSIIDDEAERLCQAGAVLRAALEAERAREEQRFAVRRRGDAILIGRVIDEEDPTALCDYAVRLGDEADSLAIQEPLPTPQRVIERLRRIPTPERASHIDDQRLVTLAASASKQAAVSGRLELYPRDMPAARALKLALGALSGSRELKLDQIRERVLGRYRDAKPLPDRPELDSLLRDAGWPYAWDDAKAAYVPLDKILATTTHGGGVTSTFTRFSTVADPTRTVTPEIGEAREFEERLRRSLQNGSFLALGVAPRYVQRAAHELAERFELRVQDLDQLLIREMQQQAERRKIDWKAALQADAEGPQGKNWPNLQRLFRWSVEQVEKQLLSSDHAVLLLYPGLIARYDQLDFLDRLRDGSGRSGSVPGIFLLVAGDRQNPLPMIDAKPVPVLGRGQWAWVPDSWLSNRHRSTAQLSER